MVFVDHPTNRTSVTQGLFKVGLGAGPLHRTHPAIPQNVSGLAGIPLKRGALMQLGIRVATNSQSGFLVKWYIFYWKSPLCIENRDDTVTMNTD